MRTAFALALLALLTCALIPANATLIDFEDLYPGYETIGPIPDGYQGLDWSSDARFYTKYYPVALGNGYEYACEGRAALFTAYAHPIYMEDGSFDFVSCKVGAAWDPVENVLFEGYADGAVVYSQTVTTDNQGGGYFTFNFMDVDKVVVTPIGAHIILDDIQIGAEDEPPTADAGPDQTVEQVSWMGTEVTLDGSGSTGGGTGGGGGGGGAPTGNLLVNGSFETGDFDGWAHDSGAHALLPWRVGTVGYSWSGFQPMGAADGAVSAINGFDGSGPFYHWLYQEVAVPATWSGGTLTWWDHIQWAHSGLPRTYEVQLRDSANTEIATLFSFQTTPDPGWIPHDLGWEQRSAEVGASYAGQTIRVYVEQHIPQSHTGPAGLGVDGFVLEGTLGGGTGSTLLIDFEDLDPGYEDADPLPAGYQGFQWTSPAHWMTKDYLPGSGYQAAIEGRVGMATASAGTITMSDGEFDFISCKVGAGWDSATDARFEGYRDGVLVGETTVPTNRYGGVWAHVGFEDVDEVRIIPTSDYLLIDDILIEFEGGEPGGPITDWDWYEGQALLGSGETLTVPFNLGLHTVTLVVTTEGGATDSDECLVLVEDTTPPELAVSTPPPYEQDSADGAFISHYQVDVSCSDACDVDPVVTFDPPEGSVLPLGTTIVTARAIDDSGNVATASFSLTVEDTTPPTLTAPPDVTVEQESLDGTEVDLGTADVSDICDAQPDITNDAPDVFPLGATMVTWTAVDDSGNVSTDFQIVTVEDTTGPVVLSASADPDRLWPPNHKMIAVSVAAQLEDVCDTAPTAMIVGVASNQPVAGPGQGKDPDWEITGALSLFLRAERDGGDGDRVYTIHLEATDASGNVTPFTVQVVVAHDQRS